MESNHHKQIQSLPHYHYANPQLNYFLFFLWTVLEFFTLTVFVPVLVLIVLLCPFLTYDPITILSLNLERVVRIELTLPVWKTGALPLSYTRKWRKEKDSNLRRLLHLGALAKLCVRPLCHLSIKSFDKLRFLQETILSVFGSIVKWSCITMAVDVRTARTFVFQRTQFSRLMQPAYICLSTV